jgi:threonine/homoserine/homoserine lactone efflux protein
MDVSEFVVAVLLLELTPGPNMAYLATLSLTRGRVYGLAATAGVAFGLSVHAILAALGAGVLIQQFASLYEVLRWVGVGYLLFLGKAGKPRQRARRAALIAQHSESTVFARFPVKCFQSQIDHLLCIRGASVRTN